MAQDYYAILGVNREASQDEIKSRMHRLALKHHPDRGGDPDKFREMWHAYEILSDSEKRRRYDKGEEAVHKNVEQTEPQYPTWEELVKMWRKLIDVSTPFDRELVGGAAYPPFFAGGEFEDPYTGDTYVSADDIRIAKEERFYWQFEEQVEFLRTDPALVTWDINKIRRCASLLKQEGRMAESQYIELMKLIEEKEGELERLAESKKETDKRIELEGKYGHIQEEVELEENRKEARRKSDINAGVAVPYRDKQHRNPPKRKGEYGHRRGKDPDERREMRREFGKIEGRML